MWARNPTSEDYRQVETQSTEKEEDREQGKWDDGRELKRLFTSNKQVDVTNSN